MVFRTGGYGTSALGMYMNTIAYQVSSSMLLRVNVGLERTLFSTSGPPGAADHSGLTRVLPGFDLTYRPAKGMLIHVSYGVSPSRMFDSRYRGMEPGWGREETPVQEPPDVWD
jgi:hypothetical protein